MTYTFVDFVREEGGDDHLLGKLLMISGHRHPPATTSFDSAMVFFDAGREVFRVAHDVEEDKVFELSRDEFRAAVKSAICQTIADSEPLDTSH